MPDPTGANLTDAEVKRIEFADPHFQKYKLADRLQELREDIERGEVHGVMTLALTADHTLVAPGGSAAADATVITSGHILVSTDGSTRALTLPDPTKFKGKLTIWKTSGVGDLTVQHTANPITVNNEPSRVVCLSDGTSWWGESTEEVSLKLT